MFINIVLIISLVINVLLGWYITRILQKFMFISDNMSDLFLTTKAFHVFVKNMYSMDSFHGEPIIQELVLRIKEVNEEMSNFREIFEYTIDAELEQELEEALNAEEEEQEKSLTNDRELRSKLYEEYIQPAFDDMVDKIIYTYRFTTLPNIDYLRADCKVWLTTILNKYDPNKGSKAFSYFSVVTKNWFIHKVKRTKKRLQTEVFMEDVLNEMDENLVSEEPSYFDKRSEVEFWLSLNNEIETWDSFMIKENEKKVLMAVRILLDSADQIEIFNKKAIYLYLREITGLNTKQVVNNLNKLRKRYRTFKTKWENSEI
jgi:hypothetical protein